MQIIIELFIPYYYYYCWSIMFLNVNCNNSEYNNNMTCYSNELIIAVYSTIKNYKELLGTIKSLTILIMIKTVSYGTCP